MITLKDPIGMDVHIDEKAITEVTFLRDLAPPGANSTIYISGKPRFFSNRPEEIVNYLSGKTKMLKFVIPGTPILTVWVNTNAIERTVSHHSHGTYITISGRDGHLHVAESKSQIDAEL